MAHIRRRAEELELKRATPGWRARRWVVEACHAWLNRNRALLIRWSKKPESHLALLQLACGLIAFKKAHVARLAHALPGEALTWSEMSRGPARVDRFAFVFEQRMALGSDGGSD
jgi:hypothetical protein